MYCFSKYNAEFTNTKTHQNSMAKNNTHIKTVEQNPIMI